MTVKASDFDRVVQKLGFQTRDSGDRLAWFEYEGKVVVRTKRSHMKGGDLPFQHSIRQQMKLSEDEFRQAAGCTLSRDAYVALLRRKGLLD